MNRSALLAPPNDGTGIQWVERSCLTAAIRWIGKEQYSHHKWSQSGHTISSMSRRSSCLKKISWLKSVRADKDAEA